MCAAVVALAAGCGSSGNSTKSANRGSATSSSTTATTATTADPFAAELAKLYAGDYVPPPTSGPAAQSGRTVWFISCGQAFENCAKAATAFSAAGAALGWKVNVVDGAANPVKANSLIKQAVAAKVDGIASIAWDCPTIKAGLLAAKDAKIPVVNFGGFDCDYSEFGGGAPLFTKTVNSRGGASYANYLTQYQDARADTIIAHTKGKATILSFEETSLANQRFNAKAFHARIAEKCPACKVISVKWQFSQVPAAATQIWKSAILQHPEATVLSNPVDDIMNLGFRSALQGSGRHDLWVMGGEGPPTNIEAIRSGVQSAALAIPPGYAWQMWAEADTLNRVFAGSTDFPETGGGWTLVDKDHLPAPGQRPPVPDYQAAFKRIWAGTK